MIATLLVAASMLAADHKPGDVCSVVSRDKSRKLLAATTDLDTFARVYRGIERGDLEPLTEAQKAGSLIEVPNATFNGGKVEMFAGQVVEVIKAQGDLPTIVKIQLQTESGRRKAVYIRDEYLMTPMELATYMGELERAEKEAKELTAKLTAIDPAEVTKALKAARIAANQADLSARKRAYVRERAKKVAMLAKKYGVSEEALEAWMKAKRIEK